MPEEEAQAHDEALWQQMSAAERESAQRLYSLFLKLEGREPVNGEEIYQRACRFLLELETEGTIH
jgi:hypothetical protein